MVVTKHCEISLLNMFCYVCYIRLWNKIWKNLACLMYRTVSRYRFKRKRRKQMPSRKLWMSLNSRDIYFGLSYCSEQNNYEIREARTGGNSFVFHIGSPKDPMAYLWRRIKKNSLKVLLQINRPILKDQDIFLLVGRRGLFFFLCFFCSYIEIQVKSFLFVCGYLDQASKNQLECVVATSTED